MPPSYGESDGPIVYLLDDCCFFVKKVFLKKGDYENYKNTL